MNSGLLQIAESLKPSPDSQLARAIQAVRVAEKAREPFVERLTQCQAELDSAAQVIASAEWDSLPEAIASAQSSQAALAVILPKIQAKEQEAVAQVQQAEATVNAGIRKAQGLSKYIAQLGNDDIPLSQFSPNARKAELAKQRAELVALVGHESVSDAWAADLAASQRDALQAQVSGIEHRRFSV